MFQRKSAPLLIALALAAPVFAQSDSRTLVHCIGGPIESFDPSRALTINSYNATAATIYDKLVEWGNEVGQVRPELAESWTVSPDGLVYTFTLRRGVRFHTVDGFSPSREMNADDVIFTFRRLMDPEMPFNKASNARYPYARAQVAGVKSIEAVDPRTVRFTLSAPSATFLITLASAPQTIMSAEYADKVLKENRVEDFSAKPVGTGPFVLRRFEKDAAARYESNKEYWGPKPAFDRYIVSIQRDSAVRLQKLKAGECHVAAPPKPTEVAAILADPNLRIAEAPGNNTGVIAFNQRVKPLDNRDVRQALSLATNRKLALETVFGGQAQEAKGLLPQHFLGASKQKPLPYNLDEAKKLMAKAGVTAPIELEVLAPQVTPLYMPDPRRMAEILQPDFASIGVNLKIVSVEYGEFLKRVVSGQYQMALAGWTSDNGDPDNYFSNLIACKVPTNVTGYCSPETDALIERARRSNDTAERGRIYEQLADSYTREVLHSPIAHALWKVPHRKEVVNLKASSTGVLNLSGVELR